MSGNPNDPSMSSQPPQPPMPPPQPGVPMQQQGYGGPPPGYQPARNNGLAVASLVLGLLWLCWLGSILAVIFGHIALSQIKKSNGTQTGRGLAIAGLLLGYLGIAFLIVSLALGEWTWNFEIV